MHSDAERVADDADLLDAARRHYTGEGDLADQLWWRDHPGTRGPSGAEDPIPALESARASLYRPDRPAGVDPQTLQRELAARTADRQAAAAALATARAERRRQPRATVSPRRRPVGLLIGIAATALLVGAASGFGFGRFTLTPAPAALRVFSAPQQTRDRPPSSASLPPLAPRSAYRLIGSSPSTGAYAYGVRGSGGDVCLVVVVLAGAAYAACTTEAAFAEGGLTLGLEAAVDPEDDAGPANPVAIAPHWSPDGRFTF